MAHTSPPGFSSGAATGPELIDVANDQNEECDDFCFIRSEGVVLHFCGCMLGPMSAEQIIRDVDTEMF